MEYFDYPDWRGGAETAREEEYYALSKIIQEQLATLTDIKEALGYDYGDRTPKSQMMLLFRTLDEQIELGCGVLFVRTNRSDRDAFLAGMLEHAIMVAGELLDGEIESLEEED